MLIVTGPAVVGAALGAADAAVDAAWLAAWVGAVDAAGEGVEELGAPHAPTITVAASRLTSLRPCDMDTINRSSSAIPAPSLRPDRRPYAGPVTSPVELP